MSEREPRDSVFYFIANTQIVARDLTAIESAAVSFKNVRELCPDEIEVELAMLQAAKKELYRQVGSYSLALIRAAYAYPLEEAGQPVPQIPEDVIEEVTFLAPVMPDIAPMVSVRDKSSETGVYRVSSNGLGIVARVCTEQDLEAWGSLREVNEPYGQYPALAVPVNDNLISVASVPTAVQ
jgi:hypothetical protein